MWHIKVKIEGYITGTNIYVEQESQFAVQRNNIDIVTKVMLDGFRNQGFALDYPTLLQEIEGKVIGGYVNSKRYTDIYRYSGQYVSATVSGRVC